LLRNFATKSNFGFLLIFEVFFGRIGQFIGQFESAQSQVFWAVAYRQGLRDGIELVREMDWKDGAG
jgi:hypothetical protein